MILFHLAYFWLREPVWHSLIWLLSSKQQVYDFVPANMSTSVTKGCFIGIRHENWLGVQDVSLSQVKCLWLCSLSILCSPVLWQETVAGNWLHTKMKLTFSSITFRHASSSSMSIWRLSIYESIPLLYVDSKIIFFEIRKCFIAHSLTTRLLSLPNCWNDLPATSNFPFCCIALSSRNCGGVTVCLVWRVHGVRVSVQTLTTTRWAKVYWEPKVICLHFDTC